MSIEPILDPKNQRFTLFPIQYPDLWKNYETQLACFWKASEIDFSKDYSSFQTCSKDEQFYIKRILAFFASMDGIVNFNINTRFNHEIKIMEALVCYQYQTMMENIHSESYSLMLDNLVRDVDEKNELFQSIKTVPSIKKIADWAFKWIDSDLPFAYRVIAYASIEAITFSGAFASIFWIKKFKGTNMVSGLIQSNEFISRDEGQHVQFACLLYKLLKSPLPFQEVFQVISENVNITKEFMLDALPCRLIGMNATSMCEYIEYIADMLLVQLGYQKYYQTVNPYTWIETISVQSKTNFFESRSSTYQSAYGLGRTNTEVSVVDEF